MQQGKRKREKKTFLMRSKRACLRKTVEKSQTFITLPSNIPTAYCFLVYLTVFWSSLVCLTPNIPLKCLRLEPQRRRQRAIQRMASASCLDSHRQGERLT
eukprot:1341148-Amorphochlora_amoeboformis.AAC.2